MTPGISSAKNPLTPSEVVFLHGDQFARKARSNKVELLHADLAVSAEELGRAILVASFLASEEAGELLFEVREEKKLLGLRKVQKLFLEPGGRSGTWPNGSLESTFSLMVRQRAGLGKNDIRNLLYEWLGEDSGVPWRAVVEKLESAMASRGLLGALEEKKSKLFSVTRYSLPDSTAALKNEEGLQSVRRQIEEGRTRWPDVFELLEKQLNKAIRARTDQDAAAGVP